MPLWSKALEAVRSYWLGPYASGDKALARLFGGPVTSGVQVSEQTALNYSAVWAAVSLISSQVASLPLIFYRRLPSGGKERFDGHPLYKLLHDEPNPETTSFIFRETLQAHALTWGNAYAEIERDGAGRPVRLWPLTPDRVEPNRERLRDGSFGPIRYRIDGRTELDASRMLHVPGLGFDGTLGYSVIRKARESIGLGIATEYFGGSFFGNGSTFGGILSHAAPRLSKDQRQEIRESIEEVHKGPERAHKFLILSGAMKYEKMGINPDDAQFLETRKFQVSEICRWFNLPPHKLRDLERATFSNIEQQAIEFVTDCLRPWLVRWEQELNRKLVSPRERNIQFFEHLVDGLLRGDIQSRYAAYAVGRQWGWLSVDDIRERENMNPLPDGTGEIYLVPQNMAPADRINEVIDAQIKEPEPEPEPLALPAADEDERSMATELAELPVKLVEALEAREKPEVGAIVAAHRALIVDVMRRMIEVESERARRAQVTPEKFAQWVGSFYPAHADHCRRMLEPAIRVHLAWIGKPDQAEAVTRELIEGHIGESVRQCRALLEAQPADFHGCLVQMLERWETQRIEDLADQVLEREVDYARTA